MASEPSPLTGTASAFVDEVLDEHIPLGRALGIECALADDSGVVSLRMPLGRLSANHVGTLYAGALYTLAELAAGAAVALIGRPGLIPVLVGSGMDFRRAALTEVTCTAYAPFTREQLQAHLAADRRHSTEITVECRADDETCCTGQFEYRWLSLSPLEAGA